MRTLGKGSFGRVKEALHVISGERIAIKILEKAKIKKDEDLMRVRREIDILKRVRHPNIIQLYEVCLTHPGHRNEQIFLLRYGVRRERRLIGLHRIEGKVNCSHQAIRRRVLQVLLPTGELDKISS
jgi:serine/threonine protein kinase